MRTIKCAWILKRLRLRPPPPPNWLPTKNTSYLASSNDVLEAVKALDINLSQMCEAYLREFVHRELIFCDVTDVTGLEYPRKPILSIYDLSSVTSTYVPCQTKTIILGTEKQVDKYAFLRMK